MTSDMMIGILEIITALTVLCRSESGVLNARERRMAEVFESLK